MKLTAPKFNVIADETTSDGRVCFYFGFGEDLKPSFAAKVRINDELKSIKEKLIEDILCWLGFTPLANHLMQTQIMERRFGLHTINLLNGCLKLININNVYTSFYFKDNAWYWTKSAKDLQEAMGEIAILEVNKIMGDKFFSNLEKEQMEQEKLSKSIKSCFGEMSDLATKGSNTQDPITKLKTIDIEEPTSSVSL